MSFIIGVKGKEHPKIFFSSFLDMLYFLKKEIYSFLPEVKSLPQTGLTGPRSWPSQITARSTSVTSVERKVFTAKSIFPVTTRDMDVLEDGVCTQHCGDFGQPKTLNKSAFIP